MIEFAISRIILCICGVILLVSASGFMDIYKEQTESDMNEYLAEDIAEMLDSFWDSKTQKLSLDGSRILPSPEHALEVKSHTVTLKYKDHSVTKGTRFGLDFELDYGEIVSVAKPVIPRTRPRYGVSYP